MITNCGATASLCGLSTDQKPSDAEVNTMFFELDTGDIYYFDGEDWQEVGGVS